MKKRRSTKSYKKFEERNLNFTKSTDVMGRNLLKRS